MPLPEDIEQVEYQVVHRDRIAVNGNDVVGLDSLGEDGWILSAIDSATGYYVFHRPATRYEDE